MMNSNWNQILDFLNLPREADLEISLRWREPCENFFEWLKEKHPEKLLELVVSGLLEPCDLTFAAEIVGDLEGSEKILVELLKYEDNCVVEGTLYGLGKRAETLGEGVEDALVMLLCETKSDAVAKIATNVLERMRC